MNKTFSKNHETAYLLDAMQTEYLRKNNEDSFCLNNEVAMATVNLLSCFEKSEILKDRDPIEFLVDKKSNTYFILGDCKTKEDVDCKVLEWVSRAAYKTEPYNSDYRNRAFHQKMRKGINEYFKTNFSEKDMEVIYTFLGNRCNHEKTVAFLRSGFDMDLLSVKNKELER